MIVSASFNFEPWLKLWATSSLLLAPAYLNANPEKIAVGSMLITAPAAVDIAAVSYTHLTLPTSDLV